MNPDRPRNPTREVYAPASHRCFKVLHPVRDFINSESSTTQMVTVCLNAGSNVMRLSLAVILLSVFVAGTVAIPLLHKNYGEPFDISLLHRNCGEPFETAACQCC